MSERPPRLVVVSQPLAEGVPQHIVDLLESIPPGAYAVDVVCPRGSTLWRYAQSRPDIDAYPFTATRTPHANDIVAFARLLPHVARADVVHAHSSKAGFLARFAAAVLGRTRSCVFTPHAWSFWGAHGAARRFYLALERVAARWCGAIIVVAEAERRAAVEAGIAEPDAFRLIYNGVDLERFAKPHAPLTATVLVVGRLAPQKRPDVAVDALERVLEAVPNLDASFVGDGPLRGTLERLLTERNLDDRIRILGARQDVPELLRKATLVLLTSDYEGCPIVVLEAMAAGVPVVATAVGGIPEIIDDGRTGLLAPRGDAAALASHVVALLTQPARAAEVGAAARRAAAARFSRERMAAETLRVYDELPRADEPRMPLTVRVKTATPWPVKIGAKLVLAHIPLGRSALSRLPIFEHGAMKDPRYARDVFFAHYERARAHGLGEIHVALELGPGDAVSSALLAYAIGVERLYLVDVAPFATGDLAPYLELQSLLRAEGLETPSLDGVASVDELLKRSRAEYLTAGLDSLRALDTGSVDFVWSQAVLEHVRRRDFADTLRELRRIMRTGGLMSHRIDLRDHLAEGINHLRFPDWLWEAEFAARAGFYTNRLRRSELVRLFEATGFEVVAAEVERWPAPPLPRSRLASQFRNLDEDDLLVADLDVVLRAV